MGGCRIAGYFGDVAYDEIWLSKQSHCSLKPPQHDQLVRCAAVSWSKDADEVLDAQSRGGCQIWQSRGSGWKTFHGLGNRPFHPAHNSRRQSSDGKLDFEATHQSRWRFTFALAADGREYSKRLASAITARTSSATRLSYRICRRRSESADIISRARCMSCSAEGLCGEAAGRLVAVGVSEPVRTEPRE
jgi:hypothetical protein